MEGSKYDWLEYASNDTIYVELFVTPKKRHNQPNYNGLSCRPMG